MRARLTAGERARTGNAGPTEETRLAATAAHATAGKKSLDAEIGLNHNEKMSDAEREPTIRKVADRLAPRFPATPRHRIEGIVAEEYDSLETGRIRIYIPTLIENSARTRLHRELKN